MKLTSEVKALWQRFPGACDQGSLTSTPVLHHHRFERRNENKCGGRMRVIAIHEVLGCLDYIIYTPAFKVQFPGLLMQSTVS